MQNSRSDESNSASRSLVIDSTRCKLFFEHPKSAHIHNRESSESAPVRKSSWAANAASCARAIRRGVSSTRPADRPSRDGSILGSQARFCRRLAGPAGCKPHRGEGPHSRWCRGQGHAWAREAFVAHVAGRGRPHRTPTLTGPTTAGWGLPLTVLIHTTNLLDPACIKPSRIPGVLQ